MNTNTVKEKTTQTQWVGKPPVPWWRSKKFKLATIPLTVIVLGGWGFATWWGWPYGKDELPKQGHVQYEFTSARPEGKLHYPGASVLQPVGASQGSGAIGANAGAVLSTRDSPDKVYEWYRDWLLAHGWRRDDNAFGGGLPTTQISLQGYTRGTRESFAIAMNNTESLARTLGKQIPVGVTVFEVRYFID